METPKNSSEKITLWEGTFHFGLVLTAIVAITLDVILLAGLPSIHKTVHQIPPRITNLMLEVAAKNQQFMYGQDSGVNPGDSLSTGSTVPPTDTVSTDNDDEEDNSTGSFYWMDHCKSSENKDSLMSHVFRGVCPALVFSAISTCFLVSLLLLILAIILLAISKLMAWVEEKCKRRRRKKKKKWWQKLVQWIIKVFCWLVPVIKWITLILAIISLIASVVTFIYCIIQLVAAL